VAYQRHQRVRSSRIIPYLLAGFALRVASNEIATLCTVANLLAAGSSTAAPRVARRLGAVRAIVFSRLRTIVLMAGIALAPTFLLASIAYAVRIIIESLGMPLRQSLVM
jgi:hypothetical protein